MHKAILEEDLPEGKFSVIRKDFETADLDGDGLIKEDQEADILINKLLQYKDREIPSIMQSDKEKMDMLKQMRSELQTWIEDKASQKRGIDVKSLWYQMKNIQVQTFGKKMPDLQFKTIEQKFDASDLDNDGRIKGPEEVQLLVSNLGLIDKEQDVRNKF